MRELSIMISALKIHLIIISGKRAKSIIKDMLKLKNKRNLVQATYLKLFLLEF